MPDFGPYVRYSDPRVYGLIEGRHWDPFQRSLLLGHHSWSDVRMNRWQAAALRGVHPNSVKFMHGALAKRQQQVG